MTDTEASPETLHHILSMDRIPIRSWATDLDKEQFLNKSVNETTALIDCGYDH